MNHPDEIVVARLDAAVARHTTHATFEAWIAACNAGPIYHPTIRFDLAGEADAKLLADAYDAEQARRGDPRRVWRTRA
ncbi:MAG: hypothetical protein R6V44_01585 [Paracoccaceae bacterium]